MDKKRRLIYIVSDSVGETAEFVVRAASTQFQSIDLSVEKFPFVNDTEILDEIVRSAKENNALITFTLVVPELKGHLLNRATAMNIPVVDILGPTIGKIESVFSTPPTYKPGLTHKLDEDYFKRVEAIEFAVKYDDGRDPRGIHKADIILIGVSRTSKTPLSQYLALKRLKVANVPVVPEVDPPEELFRVDPKKCFGLRIQPEKLNYIRKERLEALGLGSNASYAQIKRIQEELDYFEKIVDKIGCNVIDVSNRAVEETANKILTLYKRMS